MDTARSLRESVLKGPASLLLGIGVIVICVALLAVSAISLVVAVPAVYLQRYWSRIVARRP